MTSEQETDWVNSFKPRAHMGQALEPTWGYWMGTSKDNWPVKHLAPAIPKFHWGDLFGTYRDHRKYAN